MLRYIKITLHTLLLTISLLGIVRADTLKYDLNGDYFVNFHDLRDFGDQWLGASGGSANFNGDDTIDMDDFTLFAQNWRKGPALYISEFMANKGSGLTTMVEPVRQPGVWEEVKPDWIELHNNSNETQYLDGWYLTDNENNLTKWRIPDISIGSGQYKVICVSGKQQKYDPNNYPYFDGTYYHTNFELARSGEYLALVRPDGLTVEHEYAPEYPNQRGFVSYGYCSNTVNYGYFSNPTPGTANSSTCSTRVVEDTKFSYDRGFYDAPFSVTISTETQDATIHYTKDGSTPTETHGNIFTSDVNITTTTCLRAMAFKAGYLPTNADTQTYIFLDDVLEQDGAGFPSTWGDGGADYEMDSDVVGPYGSTITDDLKAVPTMSLVMNVNDWFDCDCGGADTGIYSHPEWEDIYEEEAERAVSVELFDPCGALDEFHINAVIRLAGGSSTIPWKMDKLSMRLKFQEPYGPTKLNYPLFGDDPAESFDTLVLDARMNNSWAYGGGTKPEGTRPDYPLDYNNVTQKELAQYTRDQFASDIHNAMGGYSPYGRHVHLYINGLYWGLYWIHERPDHSSAVSYFGGEKDDYDCLKHYSTLIVNGTNDDYEEMFSIAGDGLSSNEDYQLIQEYLDVPNLIDYIITNYYVGNTDWSHHNWYATRNVYDPAGRWRYHSWDAEHVMEGLYDNRTGENSASTFLHQKLEQNSEYRMLFADHVHRHFFNDGVLAPNNVTALYQNRLDEVYRAVVGESARWGDNQRYTPYTRDIEWVTERDWLLGTYFPQRTDIVLNQLRSRSWYPDVDAPVFHPHGGWDLTGFTVTMTNPNGSGTIWYTVDGNDPRLADTSSGGDITLVDEHAVKKVLIPTGDVNDNWKGGAPFDDSGWNDATFIPGKLGAVGYDINPDYDVYISYDVESTMYNNNDTCYVRIPFSYSGNPGDINYMTLKVRYDDGFVVYLNGAKIASAYAPDPLLWNSSATNQHGDSVAINFVYFDVSGHIWDLVTGDNILAIHGLNFPTNRTDLLISAELIIEGTGTGGGVSPSAIEYVPSSDIYITETTQLKARVLDSGTWSALNEATYAVGPVADNLRITEIMYHPQDTNEPNDPNEEFIELMNIGTESINLNFVSFTRGIYFTFPPVTLEPDEFIIVVKNQSAFEAQYPGFTGVIAGEYTGSLANDGERIRLEDANDQIIHHFRYEDGWYDVTDGDGFSLTIRDACGIDPCDWGLESSWGASTYLGGTPGEADTGPRVGDIVINEILAHSDTVPTDWIELYNTTDKTINIGGWFLSDSGKDEPNLMKYQIAHNTLVGLGCYTGFTEIQNFGNPSDPGCIIPFALSENGETLYLSSGISGELTLTGFREERSFRASDPDVSFGLYTKSSLSAAAGDPTDFVAMSSSTPGTANSYPVVGPIVITEIMYKPADDDPELEYIKLENISGSPVTLQRYYPDEKIYVQWKFTDGIEYTFPPDTTIEPDDYIYVVYDEDDFSSAYPGVASSRIFGPFEDDDGERTKLSNSGEDIELSKPGDKDEQTGERYYILVDRVVYSDGTHPEPGFIDPWPTTPDGDGDSLHKDPNSAAYGNDVDSWVAGAPSPN